MLKNARALIFQSKVHIIYWGECILTSIVLINSLPSRVLKGKTCYEILFGRKPSYPLLRSFGCLCFNDTLSHTRSKFVPRSTRCVFLGYLSDQKAYKLLDLSSNKLFVSRDIHFIEHVFPFASKDSHIPTPTVPIHIEEEHCSHHDLSFLLTLLNQIHLTSF